MLLGASSEVVGSIATEPVAFTRSVFAHNDDHFIDFWSDLNAASEPTVCVLHGCAAVQGSDFGRRLGVQLIRERI